MFSREYERRSFRVRLMLLFAWIFFIAALIAAGAELLASLKADKWVIMPLGTFWYEHHRDSLNLLQAVTQRYLFPWLWDPTFVAVLLAPIWSTLLAFAVLFRLFAIRRKPKRSQKSTGRFRRVDKDN